MSKTVLIVDDSSSLRQAVSFVLKEMGYDPIEACNGSDALGKLDGKRVHLIISDLNMPNMDGIAFVREVKKLPAHKFTPVIMLTTESGGTRRQEARAAGVSAWAVKPFEPSRLVELVSKLVMPCETKRGPGFL